MFHPLTSGAIINFNTIWNVSVRWIQEEKTITPKNSHLPQWKNVPINHTLASFVIIDPIISFKLIHIWGRLIFSSWDWWKSQAFTWFVFWHCPRLQTTADKLAYLVAQMVKNPPIMQETLVQSLGQEDPLEEGMATHFSILIWKIPWTGAWKAAVHGVAKSRTQLNDWAQHIQSSEENWQ